MSKPAGVTLAALFLLLRTEQLVDRVPPQLRIELSVSVDDAVVGRLDQAEESVTAKSKQKPSIAWRTSGLILARNLFNVFIPEPRIKGHASRRG
jgi:hypothetical protein